MPDLAHQFQHFDAVQERNLTKQVLRHRDEAMSARADRPLRSSDRYRAYLADPTLRPPGPWPEAARLFLPITRAVFERLLAEMWQTLFANMRKIQMKPFGDEDLPLVQDATRFLWWALGEPLKMTQEAGWAGVTHDWLFDALLDSVGVLKVAAWTPPWKAPSENARRYLSRTVTMEALDLGMLLVAPDAEGLQYPQCRFVHQEFFLSSDDVLRMKRAGFDTPDWDELGDAQQMTDRKRIELEREGERVVEFRPDSIPFVEAYERFALDEDEEEEDYLVSLFPDAQIAGTAANSDSNHGRIAGVRRLTDVFPQDDRPRRPFFPATVWRQPRQWRGLNVPDRLTSMQNLINRLHEQLVNYGDVSMLPFVFVNTFLTGEIPDLRTVRPGTTVPIDDIGGVSFAPTRSLNRHFAEQIQLAQAQVERDSNISDLSLGRTPDRQRDRTATTTMAVLQEAKRAFSMHIYHLADQASAMLSFTFRLWQEILPDDTYVQMFAPQEVVGSRAGANSLAERRAQAQRAEPTSALWDRLFTSQWDEDAGEFPEPRYVALPIDKSKLSGMFDATVKVNPDEDFDRQVLLSLMQTTSPAIATYPLGTRLLLKRLWAAMDQRGFDEVYPEWLAQLLTQQQLMAAEVALATTEGQLKQIQAQEAQQQLAQLEQGAQQFHQHGQISPQFAQAVQAMLARQGPQATNGQAAAPQGAGG